MTHLHLTATTEVIEEQADRLLIWFGQDSYWPLIVAGIILLATLFLRNALASLTIRLVKRLRKRNHALRDQWVATLRKPLSNLFLAAAVVFCLELLLPENRLSNILINLASSLLSVSMFYLLYRAVDIFITDVSYTAEKRGRQLDPTAVSYISTALKVMMITLAILAVLSQWIANISALVASVGIGGLLVALAAQDTAANLFASVAILLDKPFHEGDWVSAAGVDGSVEKIGLRSTQIRTWESNLATVPNSVIASGVIINMTSRNKRPVSISLSLDPTTESKQLKGLLNDIRELIKHTEEILEEGQMIYFDQLDERLPGISIRFFVVNDFILSLKIKEQIQFAILEMLETRLIRLASTAITVYTKGVADETEDLGAQGLK